MNVQTNRQKYVIFIYDIFISTYIVQRINVLNLYRVFPSLLSLQKYIECDISMKIYYQLT